MVFVHVCAYNRKARFANDQAIPFFLRPGFTTNPTILKRDGVACNIASLTDMAEMVRAFLENVSFMFQHGQSFISVCKQSMHPLDTTKRCPMLHRDLRWDSRRSRSKHGGLTCPTSL